MGTITYYLRGQIEVGTGGPGYRWAQGYSESAPNGGICYPWMSRNDCIRDARARGAVAHFEETPGPQSSPAPGGATSTPEPN